MPKKSFAPASTTVIYIGKPRYQLLSAHARELSYRLNADIKATTLVQSLIDDYMDKLYEKLINEQYNDDT